MLSGPQLKIDTDVIFRKSYVSANTVLVNSLHQDDIVCIHLVYQFCSTGKVSFRRYIHCTDAFSVLEMFQGNRLYIFTHLLTYLFTYCCQLLN